MKQAKKQDTYIVVVETQDQNIYIGPFENSEDAFKVEGKVSKHSYAKAREWLAYPMKLISPLDALDSMKMFE